MTEEKLLRIGIGLIVVTSPFFLWLVLRIANPQSQAELRTQIARMRMLRWISYIVGLALFLILLVYPLGRYFNLGFAVLTASVGLEIPMGWLKNRLARSEKQGNPSTEVIPHSG